MNPDEYAAMIHQAKHGVAFPSDVLALDAALQEASGGGSKPIAAEQIRELRGETVLQEAERIINGDVGLSLEEIAALWSPILGTEVKAEKVALCMIQLKVAYAMNGYQRDSIVDIAGYAGRLAKLRGID